MVETQKKSTDKADITETVEPCLRPRYNDVRLSYVVSLLEGASDVERGQRATHGSAVFRQVCVGCRDQNKILNSS